MYKAKLYKASNQLQRADNKMVLEEFKDALKFKDNDNLLDVGCGSGDVTVEMILPLMPNSYSFVMGVDVSEEMIKFAEENYSHSASRIKFESLDIGLPTLRPSLHEKFDHVTSFFCLHWIQNQHVAFENIFKLLKPGGDCLVTFMTKNPIFEIYEKLAANVKWNHFMRDVDKFISPYQHIIDPMAKVIDYLKECGFSRFKVYERSRLFVYENIEILRESVRAVNPFIKRMDNFQQEEFLNDYIQNVIDLGLQEGNGFLTPYKLMIVTATK